MSDEAKPPCPACGGTVHRSGVCKLCEMFAAAAAPGGDKPEGWPMLSDAMGVAPRQVEGAMAVDKRLGVPISYAPDGRAVYENQSQRNAHMKAHGFHDNNGGYRG